MRGVWSVMGEGREAIHSQNERNVCKSSCELHVLLVHTHPHIFPESSEEEEEEEEEEEGGKQTEEHKKKKGGEKQLRNQFNFSERASQTLNNPCRVSMCVWGLCGVGRRDIIVSLHCRTVALLQSHLPEQTSLLLLTR